MRHFARCLRGKRQLSVSLPGQNCSGAGTVLPRRFLLRNPGAAVHDGCVLRPSGKGAHDLDSGGHALACGPIRCIGRCGTMEGVTSKKGLNEVFKRKDSKTRRRKVGKRRKWKLENENCKMQI